MNPDQKVLLQKKLAEITNSIRILGAFIPIRYNDPSLNALNNISLAVITLELEIEKCQTE